LTVCSYQETSLNHIVNGLELHRRLLEEVGVALSSSEELKPLLVGVRDLRVQVEEVILNASASPTPSHHFWFSCWVRVRVLLFILKDVSSFKFTCLIILNQNTFISSLL